MHKRFSFFIWALIIFQLITTVFHSLSFFIKPVGSNATEEQMISLISTYKMDMGNGIFRTYSELVIALSISFTLICLFGALLNWFLKRKQIAPEIWKGVLLIETIVFGILFLFVMFFAFLPPMICTGLIFFSCIGSLLAVPTTTLR